MQFVRYFKGVGVRKFLYIDPHVCNTYYRVTFNYELKSKNVWTARIVDANGMVIDYQEKFEKIQDIVTDVMVHLWTLTYSG